MQEVYQGAFSKPVPVRESEKQEWAEGNRIILGVATMASADPWGPVELFSVRGTYRDIPT